MKRIFFNWLPVLLWAAIIFLFSANPDPYRLSRHDFIRANADRLEEELNKNP